MSTATQLSTLTSNTERTTVRSNARTSAGSKKPATAFYEVLTHLTKKRKGSDHHSS